MPPLARSGPRVGKRVGLMPEAVLRPLSRAAEVQLMNRVKASLPEEQPVPSAPPAPPEPPTPTDPPTPPELPRVKVLDADTRLEHLRY